MSHPRLASLGLALAAAAISTAAAAGPTVSADLNLGTATKGTAPAPGGQAGGQGPEDLPQPSPLYTVGFDVRAGWRFDLPLSMSTRWALWILPEIGGGYGVELYTPPGGTSRPLSRLFGGVRFGASYALAPTLHLEPAVFWHAGAGWYGDGSAVGSAFDVGLALDLRIGRHLIVGAHAGYNVVTLGPTPAPPCSTPGNVGCGIALPAVADPWVSYGIHAGWVFW